MQQPVDKLILFLGVYLGAMLFSIIVQNILKKKALVTQITPILFQSKLSIVYIVISIVRMTGLIGLLATIFLSNQEVYTEYFYLIFVGIMLLSGLYISIRLPYLHVEKQSNGSIIFQKKQKADHIESIVLETNTQYILGNRFTYTLNVKINNTKKRILSGSQSEIDEIKKQLNDWLK